MSWVTRNLVDGYGRTITSQDTVPAFDLPQKTTQSGASGFPTVDPQGRLPTKAQAFDLPQKELGSRPANFPLLTPPVIKPQIVQAFELPQKILGTRTVGLRLFTLPVKGPYYAKAFTYPERIVYSYGGILTIPIDYPPPWWTPLPTGINKWRLYDNDRRYSQATNRRFTYRVRG